jgi:hypothetical protein
MQKLTIAPSCMVAAFIFSVAIFTACSKSDNTTPQTTDQAALSVSASADNQADVVYNDVTSNVMGVNNEIGLGTGIGVFVADANNVAPWETGWQHCFTVTISPEAIGVYPKTVTLDFGTGCEGRDGHIRKGKIITVYTGPMFVAGSKATTTLQDFYFDTLHVEGTHILTNNSTADSHIFNSVIQEGKITSPSGNYVVWNRTHTWTQTEGNGTPYNPLDDVYSITGSSNGTIYIGTSSFQWTAAITQPLIHRFLCPWNVSGQIEVGSADAKSIFDFGDGTCDRKATLTINGNIFEIIW